ncbi:MAG: EF-hand domain-containing protein [Rheinheimera sp.]|nr:EF-hand domain-containing protein [Rheinheimera sp.]
MQIQSQNLWANRQLAQRPPVSQDQIKADASAVFQKLDSKQQGYLDQADFSAALRTLSQQGQVQQSAPDDEQQAAWFSQLDADQDGKLTSDEFSSSVAQQLYNAQGQTGMARGPHGVPPEDTGKTIDELTAMAEEIGNSDSNAAAGLQAIIDQFDSADADKDGKVTMQEAMVLQQQNTKATGSASSPTSTDSSQLRLQQTLMQLMKTYGAAAGQSADDSRLSFTV